MKALFGTLLTSALLVGLVFMVETRDGKSTTSSSKTSKHITTTKGSSDKTASHHPDDRSTTSTTVKTIKSTAKTLHCYECKDEARNEICNNKKGTCGSSANFCLTTVTTTAKGKKSITKQCSTDCPSSSLETDCCNTDLCNTSGVDGVKVSVTLLSVVMCASALLLKSSL